RPRRAPPTAAREHLYTALEIFDRLGALPWYEQTRHELRATGETVGPRTGAKERLTAQELRIALAVSEGITNREVAERLYISVKTVEYHLSAVFRKLGVTSRAQLARHPLAAKSE
ncbi:MAG: helix-turn-helix domain-containing protein, partial [Micromonosporaceae bacterium]